MIANEMGVILMKPDDEDEDEEPHDPKGDMMKTSLE